MPARRAAEVGGVLCRVAASLALAILILCVAVRVRADAPLTTADIERFLRAGISEDTILAELQSRGFAEPLDAGREASLREAGASETLIVAVRRVAPPEKPAPLPAGGATPASSATTVTATAPTFAAGTRTVRVPVSVLDKAGQPVLGLRAEDFRISEDGRRQPVTLFSGDRSALRIALALDTSRSMQNKIRQVGEALKHFIDILEPADQVLVITFDSHVHVIQDFTSDRELLGQVLDKLEPEGPTALYDAAAEAIRRVAQGPAESKAVVLVTDGVDTDSRISFDSLRELARRSEVPVFSIGLDAGQRAFRISGGGPGGGWGRFPGGRGGFPGGGRGGWPGGGGRRGGGRGGPGDMKAFDAKPLEELADDTGARAEIVKGLEHYTPGSDEPPGSAKLKAAVESIAMTLRHRYLVGYDPPEGKAGWRTIKVDVDRPATSARTRKGYYSGA